MMCFRNQIFWAYPKEGKKEGLGALKGKQEWIAFFTFSINLF